MGITPDMEIAAVVMALLAFAGYREWLRHQRRILIHRERLTAECPRTLLLARLNLVLKRNLHIRDPSVVITFPPRRDWESHRAVNETVSALRDSACFISWCISPQDGRNSEEETSSEESLV